MFKRFNNWLIKNFLTAFILLLVIGVCIIGLYIFKTNIDYQEKVIAWCAVLGASLGGATTLIAVGISNIQSNKIQEKASEDNRRQIKFNLLAKKSENNYEVVRILSKMLHIIVLLGIQVDDEECELIKLDKNKMTDFLLANQEMIDFAECIFESEIRSSIDEVNDKLNNFVKKSRNEMKVSDANRMLRDMEICIEETLEVIGKYNRKNSIEQERLINEK